MDTTEFLEARDDISPGLRDQQIELSEYYKAELGAKGHPLARAMCAGVGRYRWCGIGGDLDDAASITARMTRRITNADEAIALELNCWQAIVRASLQARLFGREAITRVVRDHGVWNAWSWAHLYKRIIAVDPRTLIPGDCIAFAPRGDSKAMDHVGVYLGSRGGQRHIAHNYRVVEDGERSESGFLHIEPVESIFTWMRETGDRPTELLARRIDPKVSSKRI